MIHKLILYSQKSPFDQIGDVITIVFSSSENSPLPKHPLNDIPIKIVTNAVENTFFMYILKRGDNYSSLCPFKFKYCLASETV